MSDLLCRLYRGWLRPARLLGPILLGALLLGGQSATTEAQRVSIVLITIRDADTRAILPRVSVTLRELGIAQSTDSNGVARVAAVPAGTYSLEARRLGYDPAQATLVVGAHQDTVSMTVAMHAVPQHLDSTRVVGAASKKWLSEFEERRAQGRGQFITTAQLDSMAGSSLDAVFARRVRGFRIVSDRSTGLHITSLRPPSEHALRGSARAICPPLVFLDGVPLSADDERGPDITVVQTATLGAVEVYAPSEIPVRYRTYGEMAPNATHIVTGASCGAVLLWSRP